MCCNRLVRVGPICPQSSRLRDWSKAGAAHGAADGPSPTTPSIEQVPSRARGRRAPVADEEAEPGRVGLWPFPPFTVGPPAPIKARRPERVQFSISRAVGRLDGQAAARIGTPPTIVGQCECVADLTTVQASRPKDSAKAAVAWQLHTLSLGPPGSPRALPLRCMAFSPSQGPQCHTRTPISMAVLVNVS